MHPSFRTEFESRGRTLSILGEAVGDMSREELHAVIGFLLEMSDLEAVEAQLERYAQDEAHKRAPRIDIDPPSNDGLVEG